MVSWWVTDTYFNDELIQIGDIEIITAAYGSAGSFVSMVRSKYIKHNTYTYIRSNFRSKPTPIHVPVHKYDLNYSYSRSHFVKLPQEVSKKIIYRLSHKASYASKIIYPVVDGFSPNEVRINLPVCDYSIVTFGISDF